MPILATKLEGATFHKKMKKRVKKEGKYLAPKRRPYNLYESVQISLTSTVNITNHYVLAKISPSIG